MSKEKFLNAVIQARVKEGLLDANLLSDGYHTFGELYEHRIRLFIELGRALMVLKKICDTSHEVWISMRHSDNSVLPGWMIMGINTEPGKQLTYHLPDKYWAECTQFAVSKYQAPDYDGHTGADTLERLKHL